MYQSNARVVASDLIHAHPLTCSRPAGARTRHCVRTTVVHEAGRTGADVSAGGCDYAGSGLVILRSHHSTDQAVNTRRAVTCATVEAVNGCAYSAVTRAVQRLRMQARRGTCSSGRTVEDGHARTNARPRTHARVRAHTHTHTLARAKTVTPSFLLFRTILLFPQDQEGPSIAEWNGIKRKFKKTDKTVTCECHL